MYGSAVGGVEGVGVDAKTSTGTNATSGMGIPASPSFLQREAEIMTYVNSIKAIVHQAKKETVLAPPPLQYTLSFCERTCEVTLEGETAFSSYSLHDDEDEEGEGEGETAKTYLIEREDLVISALLPPTSTPNVASASTTTDKSLGLFSDIILTVLTNELVTGYQWDLPPSTIATNTTTTTTTTTATTNATTINNNNNNRSSSASMLPFVPRSLTATIRRQQWLPVLETLSDLAGLSRSNNSSGSSNSSTGGSRTDRGRATDRATGVATGRLPSQQASSGAQYASTGSVLMMSAEAATRLADDPGNRDVYGFCTIKNNALQVRKFRSGGSWSIMMASSLQVGGTNTGNNNNL